MTMTIVTLFEFDEDQHHKLVFDDQQALAQFLSDFALKGGSDKYDLEMEKVRPNLDYSNFQY